jgi:hypothetical protein
VRFDPAEGRQIISELAATLRPPLRPDVERDVRRILAGAARRILGERVARD